MKLPASILVGRCIGINRIPPLRNSEEPPFEAVLLLNTLNYFGLFFLLSPMSYP